eukprot:2498905-Pyramimonas_sp.AAC.1
MCVGEEQDDEHGGIPLAEAPEPVVGAAPRAAATSSSSRSSLQRTLLDDVPLDDRGRSGVMRR